MTFDILSSVDHLRENGGISQWTERDNVNRALSHVPRLVRVTEEHIARSADMGADGEGRWYATNPIALAAADAFGTAQTEGDYQTKYHSIAEVSENYMRVEWYRPGDPHEKAATFGLPALARINVRRDIEQHTRMEPHSFLPIACDPDYVPGEISGCPDESDDAKTIADEAHAYPVVTGGYVAVTRSNWEIDGKCGRMEGRGCTMQAARNDLYRKMLNAFRAT